MSPRRLRDQALNAVATLGLLARLRHASIRTILDVRYGSGDLARQVLELWPTATLYGMECDVDTYEVAWRPPGDNLALAAYHGPEDLPAAWPRAYDLLLADFSNVTQRNRGQLDEVSRGGLARFLLFADVASGKLHLHRRTYGLAEDEGLEVYWYKWDVPGYRILAWHRAHYRCSFGLYVRADPPSA